MNTPTQLQRRMMPLTNAPASFKIIDPAQGDLRLLFTVTEPVDHWHNALTILCFGLFFIVPFYFIDLLFCFTPLFLGLCLVLVRFLRRASTRYEYELQPDQIIFRHDHLLGLQRTTSIPKTWIRSVRSVLKPGGGEGPDEWTVELVWADQKVSLLPDWTRDERNVQWLARVIALWAELGLVWQSSSGAEMLYQAKAAPAVGQRARSHLMAADISQGWKTLIFIILLLNLFALIYVTATDWLVLVLGLGFTGLWIFALFLKLLAIFGLTAKFQQEGVETEGVISKRWIEYAPEPKEDQYWLAYQFPEGTETKVKVKQVVYDAHQVGDPVEVAYLSTDPHISFIKWEVSFRFFRRRFQDDYHGRRQ
jgi:hypothetical protein